MGWYALLTLRRTATYLIIKKKKNGSTIAVKCGQLGDNKDSFMPIFFADTLDFQIVI